MPLRLPSFLTGCSPKKHLLVALLVFLPLFLGLYLAKIEPDRHPSGDEKNYLAAAYNMVRHDVYSTSLGQGRPAPDAHRPPAYSWFLSLGMRYLPSVANADYGWFESGQKQTLDPAFIQLKYMQLALLLGTAGLSAWLILQTTGKPAYAQWGLWLVAFNPVLQRYVERFYSETFGIFLIALYSALLYHALKRRKAYLFLLPGILLGGITLTFTQWKLMLPFAAASVVVYALFEKARRWNLLAGALLLVIGFQCVVMPWRMRNEDVLQRNYVSGRGGAILLLRTNYDQMDAAAYACSFFYWSYGLPKALLKRFVDPAHYAYLDRDNPEGARLRMRAEVRERILAHGDEAGADKQLIRDSVRWMLHHPVRHLLVSLPIALRTMQDPTFSVLNLLVYFALFYAIWRSIRRRDFPTACVLVVTIPLLGFNILATHGLPRYSWQLIPLLWVGALTGLHLYRSRSGAEPPPLDASPDAR